MVNPNRDRPQGTWGDGILSYSVRGSRHLGFRSKDADPNQRSGEIRGRPDCLRRNRTGARSKT